MVHKVILLGRKACIWQVFLTARPFKHVYISCVETFNDTFKNTINHKNK